MNSWQEIFVKEGNLLLKLYMKSANNCKLQVIQPNINDHLVFNLPMIIQNKLI